MNLFQKFPFLFEIVMLMGWGKRQNDLPSAFSFPNWLQRSWASLRPVVRSTVFTAILAGVGSEGEQMGLEVMSSWGVDTSCGVFTYCATVLTPDKLHLICQGQVAE